MNMWYSVVLLSKFTSNNIEPDAHTLWEENVVLVFAGSEHDAREEAIRIGTAMNNEYRNESGDLIQVRFDQIERIYPVEDTSLANGSVVLSRFLRDSEVRSILRPIDD